MADKFQAKLAFLGCLSAFPFFSTTVIFFYLQQVKISEKSAFLLAGKSATR
ncbi:hypothetical protein HMPREF9065_00359 [Aggregatibacter sp. oral taxon 458 str. W10330]|nr:hypothetical protein HMPREF9065_00359 [Aggregatibacter sp. oral taxon 458 str. W10330]